MLEFFAMGGYAAYVWSAFGLTAVVLIGNFFAARRAHARVLAAVRRERLADDAAPIVREVVR